MLSVLPDVSSLSTETATIQTRLGAFRVAFTKRGLSELTWAGAGTSRSSSSDPRLQSLIRELNAYAAGEAVPWTVPLDLSAGTAFQQQVWRALQRIPHGETRSYAWVARQIGRPSASRAVGAACGANPVPVVVPCHRVLASDGSLGGFSAGLHRKRQLLALEKSLA